MKDFEKDLSGLREPDIQVEEFKRTLRRDLRRSMQTAAPPSWKIAFALSSVAATAFAVLLTLFVLDPEVPARLHASVTGAGGIGTTAPAGTEQDEIPDLRNVGIEYLLNQVNASAQVDRAFLEDWYEDRARPVQVKAVEDERILAIRQFKLSNGERVIVLTELGTQLQRKDVQTVSASFRDF